MKSKILILTAVALSIGAIFTGSDAMAAKQPKLVAAKFHADWCGSCKAMGDAIIDLSNKFDGKEVLFVTFDRTNTTTRHHSELLASAMDLDKVYDGNEGTGYVLLIDAESGEVIEKMKGMTAKEMGNTIAGKL
ncbi:MAG: thioredoxin family protein [Verrucomicrobiota bacterium]